MLRIDLLLNNMQVVILMFFRSTSGQDMAKMNREREDKIRRYKESKELEISLKALKANLEHCDEDLVREYYLKLIRKSVISSLDEITSFETEKEILAHMAKMRETTGGVTIDKPAPKKRPLKPIIITRYLILIYRFTSQFEAFAIN